MTSSENILAVLERIASSLERIANKLDPPPWDHRRFALRGREARLHDDLCVLSGAGRPNPIKLYRCRDWQREVVEVLSQSN
jgi:hypothetical protein